jgi:hypothetical protein
VARSLSRFLLGGGVVLASAFVGLSAFAGSIDHPITVRVHLFATPSGQCTSKSLSEQTNASVTVTCSMQEFVSIEAVPGRPYAFTHGGAHRWLPRSMSQGLSQAGIWREGTLGIGTGTITGLRVLRVSDANEPLELLVSF